MNHMTQPPVHGSYNRSSDTIYDETVGWVPANEFYSHHGIPTYGDADTKMSRNKQAALIIGAIAALLVAVALTAVFMDGNDSEKSPFTSSEQKFIQGAKDLDMKVTNSGGDGYMIDSGYTICDLLNDGYSADEVAEEGWENSVAENGDGAMSYVQARGLVRLAQQHLC